jgi:hypothetical protein
MTPEEQCAANRQNPHANERVERQDAVTRQIKKKQLHNVKERRII